MWRNLKIKHCQSRYLLLSLYFGKWTVPGLNNANAKKKEKEEFEGYDINKDYYIDKEEFLGKLKTKPKFRHCSFCQTRKEQEEMDEGVVN